jgi:hypothetical protein
MLALSDALSDALSALSDSPLISIGVQHTLAIVLAKVTFRRQGGPQAVLWLSRCRRSKTWNVCMVLPGRTPSAHAAHGHHTIRPWYGVPLWQVVTGGMVWWFNVGLMFEVEYVSFMCPAE